MMLSNPTGCGGMGKERWARRCEAQHATRWLERPPRARHQLRPSVWTWAVAVVALTLTAGCASTGTRPDLGEIYAEAAHSQNEMGNPVILVPGMTGSNLIDRESGLAVWGAYRGGSVDVNTAKGARLVALPMAEGVPLDQLHDRVVPDGVIDRVRFSLLRLPFSLDAYTDILRTLRLGGFRDESFGHAAGMVYGKDHFTCFQFGYDFRRSNAENAARLDDFIREKESYLREEYRKRGIVRRKPIKFDLVAHSMGGLLVRYYLRYGRAALPADGSLPAITWAGAQKVGRVILVGTPNAGSAETLERLTQGINFTFVAHYPPAVLGTFTSAYELLPRQRHRALLDPAAGEKSLDLLDFAEWERRGWGLADPKQDEILQKLLPEVSDRTVRRRIALDHLAKCLRNARQFQAALDVPATPPSGTQISLIAGDAIATPAVMTIGRHGLPEVQRRAAGDGVVTRSSALMDERMGRPAESRLQSPVAWDTVLFISSGHREMTGKPEFIDNMLHLLLEAPDKGPREN